MKLSILMGQLSRALAAAGDMEVLIHVTNHADDEGGERECIGDVRAVTVEQSHAGDETFFVRITGDDEE